MIILRQVTFSDKDKRKEKKEKKVRNSLIATGGASGLLIGQTAGEVKKAELMDKAIKQAKSADLHATRFNRRLEEVARRGVRPEDAEQAAAYLNTIKKRIEKEGQDAIKLAKKANKAPYKGMAIGTAAGATLGYGVHKYLKHKNNKK